MKSIPRGGFFKITGSKSNSKVICIFVKSKCHAKIESQRS